MSELALLLPYLAVKLAVYSAWCYLGLLVRSRSRRGAHGGGLRRRPRGEAVLLSPWREGLA